MKKFLMLIPALLAIASCAKEVASDAIQQPDVQEKVFTCSLENDATKVYVDDQSRLYWNEGDLVSIFTRGLNEKYMFAGKDGDIGGTFTFVGQQTFGTGSSMSANYAVYPYYESTKADYEGNISVVIPAVQQYKHGSFGPGANLMVAVTENTDDFFLPFKNVCGYLSIKLFGQNVCVKKITFKGNNDEPLIGKATIKSSHTELPEITIAADGGKEIVLDCGSGVTIGKNKDDAATFWMVVPPMTFTKGFTFIIEAVNGEIFEKTSTKEQIIQRNICKDMSPVNINSAYAATNVTEVTLDQDVIYFKEAGEKIQLHATVYPEDATNKNVFWTSFDESIATVDQDGTVTAVGEGEVTIEVKTEDGGHTAEATARIDWTPPMIESISYPKSIDITDGPVEFTIEARITDPSGVADGAKIWLLDDSSWNLNTNLDLTLVSGTEYDGIYRATYTFKPLDNAPGKYNFSIVYLYDTRHNGRSGDCQYFEVINNSGADFTPPSIEYITYPKSIDITDGPVEFTIEARITDPSGVADGAKIWLLDDSSWNLNTNLDLTLISGTEYDGIYRATYTFKPLDNAPGKYNFSIVYLYDTRHNGRSGDTQYFEVINNN